MKPILIHSLILILGLASLTSCGTGTKEASLEVSKAFATANTTFGGGLIVHGESASGSKFTIAIKDGLSRTIKLQTDIWTFYAIGYDGGTAPEDAFKGNTYCGKAIQDLNAGATVDISVSQANCADPALLSELDLNDVYTLSCGLFHSYNTGSNTFANITSASSDTYCDTLPIDMRGDMKYVKYVAVDSFATLSRDVFKSSCLPLPSAQRKLPLKMFSLKVETYPSLPDCMAESRKLAFDFVHGLNIGRPLEFDHRIHTMTPVTTKRLILPAGISRRGTSPFIVNATNMVPRILCGAGPSFADCIADHNDAIHVDVPFTNSRDDQLLFKGTKATTVPSNIFASAGYFSVTDVTLQDGNLRGKVHRNTLTCQPSTTPPELTLIKDIYTRDGLIFILRGTGGNDFVSIYTSQGRFLDDVDLGANTFSKVAARKASSTTSYLYLANSVDSYLTIFSSTGSTYSITTSANLDPAYGYVNDLDVTSTGIVFASRTLLNVITSYDQSANSIIQHAIVGSVSTVKVQETDGLLYALTSDPKIKRYTIDATTHLLSYVSDATGIISTMADFDINSTTVIARVGTSIHSGTYASTGTFSLTANSGSDSFSSMFLLNGKIYGASSSFLKVYTASAGTVSTFSQHVYVCNETVSVQPSALDTAKSLNVKTNNASNFVVFDEAMRIIGRTTTAFYDQNSYLFRSMQNDDSRSSGGGMLRRVQEHLTSGVTSLLPGNSCMDVYNNATTPISVSKVIQDLEGSFLVDVSVARSSTIVPDYICVDNDPTATGCATTFDLNVSWKVTKLGALDEKGLIKLKCDRALGIFETLEPSSSETHRESTLWNTGAMDFARFENYEVHTGSKPRAEIITFEKSGTNIFNARTVSVQTDSGKTFGNASELEGNGTYIFHLNKHLEDTTANFFANSGSFATDRADTDFMSLTSTAGIGISETSFYMGYNNGNFAYSRNTTSTGLNLNMDELNGFESSGHAIYNQFSLAP